MYRILLVISSTTFWGCSVIGTINLSTMPNPSDIDTFAFATWGGEFWVFIRTYGMGSSTGSPQMAR